MIHKMQQAYSSQIEFRYNFNTMSSYAVLKCMSQYIINQLLLALGHWTQGDLNEISDR